MLLDVGVSSGCEAWSNGGEVSVVLAAGCGSQMEEEWKQHKPLG